MTTVICPHCEDYIIITELNCGIFRHAVHKNGDQVDPHLPKKECDHLVKQGEVLGCCKPFRIKVINGEWKVEKCEYI
jgi:ArsR family metal-binding transcriptional regulator